MEQVGKIKLYSMEEVLDKHFGPIGTTRRDEHEKRVADAVHAYQIMKKTIITALLTLLTIGASAQIKVEVSETVELMGILSRTAGFEEYCMDMSGQYTKDTETWFTPYKEHPTIAYCQKLRNNQGISHDAVMSMAIHLDINNGKIKFLGEKSDLEERWQNVDVDDFVARLNQFYTDTRFHDFFEQHRTFYNEGLKDYEANVMPFFHQEWYTQFYGTEATEQFHIIVGFTCGGHNYGPARQLKGQPREVFSICGYNLTPATGKPYWDAAILFHELNHSFVNHLLDNVVNAAMMEKVGQKLFQFSQFEMQQQAYNDWETVINESVVRAAVFIYMLDNKLVNRNTPQFMLDEMYRRGFRWMPELVTALRRYNSQRNQYKTLNDFYPEIASCLGKYVDDETKRIVKALK